MIPKIINYCWFGKGQKPDLVLRCIESWKKYCPEYQIIEWNESNFDVEMNDFVKGAYQEKKYSFVSDFARLYIIYNYGGIYLDTDVELLGKLDGLLEQKAYIGTENFGKLINPGSGFGAIKNFKIIKEFLDVYTNLSFENEDGILKTVPITCLLTPLLKNKGWIDNNIIQKIEGLTVYPTDYFCPKDYDGILKITKNTYSIHHFSATWIDEDMHRFNIWQEKISKIFGKKVGLIAGYLLKVYNRKGLIHLIKRFPAMVNKYFKKN